ncbi:MAG: hypothetical protein LBU60_06010 [Clostridiales bacterium]|jgi:uncharacterized membrane protein YccF (DUF307 family)|nr:hypothetical protein [Clostridiales bacterium]
MKILANIVWFLVVGWVPWLVYGIAGLLLCISIVGMPFGLQAFKFSKLLAAPFGKKVELNPSKHLILNIVWFILLGWSLALYDFIWGCILVATIVFVPIGLQMFKFGKLGAFPFGAKVW